MTAARAALAFALLVLAASATAGCLDALGARVDKLRARDIPQPDFEAGWEDPVQAPSHSKSYAVPVAKGAEEFSATLTLLLAAPQDAPFPVSPAQLTLSVRDPAGAPVGETKTVDPRNAVARLTLKEFPAFGDYTLVVAGNGLSGNDYGARYNLTANVFYPGGP